MPDDSTADSGPDPDLDALDHDRFVRRAIELAREADAAGDGPFGSVLVRDGAVVAEARNRVRTENDIAEHPELTLARRAAAESTPAERARTVMYTSTEPCPMCAGGIAIAGLGAVVYSVPGARLAGARQSLPCGEVFERRDADVAVVGEVRLAEGLAVHGHDADDPS